MILCFQYLKLIETGETQDMSQPRALEGQQVEWECVGWLDGSRVLANAHPSGVSPPKRTVRVARSRGLGRQQSRGGLGRQTSDEPHATRKYSRKIREKSQSIEQCPTVSKKLTNQAIFGLCLRRV